MEALQVHLALIGSRSLLPSPRPIYLPECRHQGLIAGLPPFYTQEPLEGRAEMPASPSPTGGHWTSHDALCMRHLRVVSSVQMKELGATGSRESVLGLW